MSALYKAAYEYAAHLASSKNDHGRKGRQQVENEDPAAKDPCQFAWSIAGDYLVDIKKKALLLRGKRLACA